MSRSAVAFDPDRSKTIAYDGVPDVRVIVFRGVPVMAMLRLPTRASDGRANLHQGAVGAGIDLATGRTTDAVQSQPADTSAPRHRPRDRGSPMPELARLLDLAARCPRSDGRSATLGVDVVLDAHHGPLLLELNARPGLSHPDRQSRRSAASARSGRTLVGFIGSASKGRRARRIRSGSLRGRVIAAAT